MITINGRQKEILENCKKFNIETDLNKRWEKGIAHHPNSFKLMETLKDIDWLFGDDYFCWKVGGDGDNGESLMYEMDILYELADKVKATQ